MEHKNYSKFSKPYTDNNQEQMVSEDTANNVQVTEEIVTEQPVVEEAVINQKVDETTGVVDNCDRLCVRKESTKESDVVSIIDKASEVVIDLEKSTNDFYKVKVVSNGIEGYCMKKFIKIN